MTDATAALLTDYVQQGGTVVFGCRTGYKDQTGQCPMRPFPGPVADLCGVTVADFTRTEYEDIAPPLRWAAGSITSTAAFSDILRVEGAHAEVLATYDGDYYAGAPALVRNTVGAGSALYYGSVFTADTATAIINLLGIASSVGDWLELPPSIELSVRVHEETSDQLSFLLNYTNVAQKITLHKAATELISDRRIEGTAEIAPYGVFILSPV